MIMSRKRKAVPVSASRQPHPDPRIEAELQAIVAARRAVARQEEQIALNLREIGKLRGKARENAGYYSGKESERMAGRLVKENAEMEAGIGGFHQCRAEGTAAFRRQRNPRSPPSHIIETCIGPGNWE